MNKLIDYFTRQGAFVNIITLAVIVLGMFSIFKIQREVFPNISFDVITVTTAYRGASAESTERLITNPLEQDLREVDGIKKMTSVSAEGQSVIVLQLDPDQVTADEAEADIQDVVDAFRDLPEGAEDPIVVVAESKLRPTITVALSGEVDEETLRQTAKRLEREIERLPEVAKINYNGLRDFEIRIEAIPERLRRYRVSLVDLINSLRRNNLNIPGGRIDASGDRKEMIVRTIGEYKNVEDVANTVVRANALAQAIRVKDVAKVTRGFEKESRAYSTNGSPSINLTVLKKERGDAITMVDLVKARVAELTPSFPSGIQVSFTNDISYIVRRRLNVLTNNLMVGLGLVLVFLSLILPMRVAAITAFGIPFSFLGAIAIFYFGNISLNVISMMGLIIVVGMLVDDAIVITENAQSEMEKGLAPQPAAIKGTQGIWAPVTVSVLTTVMAFAPMMFMTGIFGKFVKYIPIGVVVALLVSLWECFFILPHHMAAWVKVPKAGQPIKKGAVARLWEGSVLPYYQEVIARLLRFRYLVLALVLGATVGSVAFTVKFMDFILFPPGAIDTFYVRMEAPVGTPLATTKELIKPIEAAVARLPDYEMRDFTTQIGLQGGGGFADRSKSGNEYAQINVYLTAATERERKAIDMINELRQELGKPEGLSRVTFERARGGPPVGKPVSVGVRGESYDKIMAAIEALKKRIIALPGVSDLQDSFIEGKEEIVVRVKDAEVAAAGLSINDVGTAVRAAYEGIVPTAIRTLDEEIDIRVTMQSTARGQSETLDNLLLTNPRGNLIPLPRVARLSRAQGIATYEHEDNQRQVNLYGEIDTSVSNSRAVNAEIRKWIPELRKDHPEVSFHFGGEDSDTRESMQTLVSSFAFAVFGILMLLILLFRNLYQPLVIAATIPMGAVAVIWIFFVHQRPLTFLAMVGVIALAGVIVNNAIVFMDFVNKARSRDGLDRFESIKAAASRRLRPIFLTTVTTVVGILPTAYGVGGLDPFVVPIALALGWGMACGAVLTTLVLPPSLAIMDDVILGLRLLGKKLTRTPSS